MAPDRTILHLFKKNPRPPPPLKNYGVHTIKPQLRPCIPSNLYKLSLTLIDTEEGHLLIENFVNIYFVTSSSVSLHNLLDFYNLFCLCCIVMSLRSVTH
jgi:hypothetical protein